MRLFASLPSESSTQAIMSGPLPALIAVIDLSPTESCWPTAFMRILCALIAPEATRAIRRGRQARTLPLPMSNDDQASAASPNSHHPSLAYSDCYNCFRAAISGVSTSTRLHVHQAYTCLRSPLVTRLQEHHHSSPDSP